MRYQQVCPVSLATDVITERWTPLILREIVRFEDAVDDGAIRLDGPPDLVKAFPTWLWPSHFAHYVRMS